MARFSYPGSTTGSELGTKLNEDFDDLLTVHRGTSRPGYLSTGPWIDESGSEPVLKYYDGDKDIPLYTINETEGVIEFKDIDVRNLSEAHTGWAHGLSNVEIDRINLGANEVLNIERLSFRKKGGGSSSNASVRVQDISGNTTIVSQNLGGVTKDVGRSSAGNTLAVQISNSTGGEIEAAINLSAKIEQAK